MNRPHSLRKQRGFTLVEIAIVLVIIGLLLGGVLKGQEMIENARIKSVVADINGVAAAYNSYVDRYRAIPGDELVATRTARGWVAVAGGNANGVLDVASTATFANTGEQASLWNSLRASGLTSGDAAATGVPALPRAGTGGVIGVSRGAFGMTGITICVQNLTAKQAAGIDSAIDGPVVGATIPGNIGSVRAAATTGGGNSANPSVGAPTATVGYDESVANQWTVCRSL